MQGVGEERHGCALPYARDREGAQQQRTGRLDFDVWLLGVMTWSWCPHCCLYYCVLLCLFMLPAQLSFVIPHITHVSCLQDFQYCCFNDLSVFAAASVRHQPRDLPRRAQDVDAGLRDSVPRLPALRDQRHAEQQRLQHPRKQHVRERGGGGEIALLSVARQHPAFRALFLAL